MAPAPAQKKDVATLQPRSYQLELLDYVMERNAIIYLPTGAGKTFVAILALKRYSHTIGRSVSEGGKRAIFMCNTVELARQQYEAIKKNTNFKTGCYIGERDVDSWHKSRWHEEIDENQVLVGTAQIFLNVVTQNLINISDFSVVVIDECHHATGKHPMREFLKLFQLEKKQNELPRVIGLTGVLLKGNKLNDIVSELSALEAVFRGNIITVRSMEQYENVMLYSTKPNEVLIPYACKDAAKPVELEIIKFIENTIFKLVDEWYLGTLPIKMSRSLGAIVEPSKKKYIKNLFKDFLYQMNDFGLYAAGIAIMSPIIEMEVKKRQAETLALRALYRYCIGACENIRHLILNTMNAQFTNDDDDDDDDGDDTVASNQAHDSDAEMPLARPNKNLQTEMYKLLTFATPKLAAMLNYLKDTFKNKKPEDICALIFVDRRYTAKCLYYVIMQWIECNTELQSVLRPQFMVGRNSILPSIESLLDRKWNKTAIQQFRTGECNMIICSSVLEEGIDIQACNYVIAYDQLKTFTSYIQTKGRARSNGSTYVIFSSKENRLKVAEQIAKYQEVHDIIKNYLIGRILDKEDPSEDDTKAQFIETIEPFTTASGAILLASNSLPLLYRYCTTLPTDSFGIIVPWFQLHKNGERSFQVSLKLPLQSPVKETIMGDLMPSARMAKISSAFNACKQLYNIGELNQHLLPISKKECLLKATEIFFEHWKKYNDDVVTRKQKKQTRRIYDKAFPAELTNAIPKVGDIYYAYEIKVSGLFELNDYNEHIIDALKNENCYAILLRHRLPALAEMPLFMNQGKINAKVVETPIIGRIENEDQLRKLARFHITVFRDILQCWTSFFVLDQRNDTNSYLIVPIKAKAVDWSFIERFQTLPAKRTYSTTERLNKVYRPEDYVGTIVTKWYTADNSDFYVVTKVREDLTTMSPFDDASYETFKDFAEQRYHHDIERVVQRDQFLIEVRQLTKRRNFFVNATGKSKVIAKLQRQAILIPELCHNYEYPGHMWIKATFLPSILHRLQFMLHAEALRKRFNDFLGIENSPNYRPRPLMVDASLRRAVDTDGNATEITERAKVMLPAMPTKSTIVENNATHSVMEQQPWKDYMEPLDVAREPLKVFPVDVDYYYKFIAGVVSVINATEQTDEEFVNNQFDIPQFKPAAAANAPVKTLSSITDVPMTEKCDLQLLMRSLQLNDSSSSSNGSSGVSFGAEQFEYLAALTTASANDVFDMERLEILGDSFLKLASSLYLVNRFPKWHEGFLSEIKSRIVSNRNLLYCMLDLDMAKLICAGIFQPTSEWLPPLASLPLNLLQLLKEHEHMVCNVTPADLYALDLSEEEVLLGSCANNKLTDIAHRFKCQPIVDSTTDDDNVLIDYESQMFALLHKMVLPDKMIADTLEALLGVCVKNYGIQRSFAMLEFFGICKAEEGKNLRNLLDLNLGSPLLRTNITQQEVDGFLINYQKLEENLGYHFKDRAYLLQALTHPSYPTNRLTGCYQELEFIGDAILDFLISAYLYERFEHMTPGMLTDMRSALVNNITLGCICVRHRFHLFILAENSKLSESIKVFDDFQATQNYHVTDQVRILQEELIIDGNKKKGYNMATTVDVPKTLGDVVEALIAAVYLDSRDLLITWNVIYHLFAQELTEFAANVPMDPVRQLYEHKSADPKFSDAAVEEDIVMVTCWFNCLDKQVEVNGFGTNAKMAKKCAAKSALGILMLAY